MRLCSALLVLFTSNRTPHGGAPPKARGMDAELEQKLQQRLQLQDELPDVQHAVARARVRLCTVQCRHARVSQQALQVYSQMYAMHCKARAPNLQLVCVNSVLTAVKLAAVVLQNSAPCRQTSPSGSRQHGRSTSPWTPCKSVGTCSP